MLSSTSEEGNIKKQKLESKKYNFSVEGSMPILEFDITSSSSEADATAERQHLRLELYNPLSGEVFEAKFNKGRIEVDKDGSVTYFTTNSDRVNLSLFLARNLTISLSKSGDVTIKTPSRIVSVDQDIRSRNQESTSEVGSDTIKFRLE